MAWTKQLTQLRDALATLIPFANDAFPHLAQANINYKVIALSQNPVTLWFNILSYTEANQKLDELVDVLLISFPGNPHLLSFKEQLKYSLGPELSQAEWKSETDIKTLEKVTGHSSTLLPISFLEKGLQKANCVARVAIKRNNGTEVGTGFLLPNNLFLTNHHVIPDIATAKIAIIQFKYEQSVAGLLVQPRGYELEPDKKNAFATSVNADWTAIRMKGDPNAEFGAIELNETNVRKDDFVNIIQHPGGLHKQIGMYHNVVTYCDNNIIQYLTDTEPGSSGAPVFNSQWEVVALHHSGGMLKEPGSSQTFLRNEGININIVRAGITANHL